DGLSVGTLADGEAVKVGRFLFPHVLPSTFILREDFHHRGHRGTRRLKERKSQTQNLRCQLRNLRYSEPALSNLFLCVPLCPLWFIFPTLKKSALGIRLQILLEPTEHGLVPQLRVLRLQDPMAFVREVEELGVNIHALERREELQAFGDGHAVI